MQFHLLFGLEKYIVYMMYVAIQQISDYINIKHLEFIH